MSYQHPELGPPVSHVVQPEDHRRLSITFLRAFISEVRSGGSEADQKPRRLMVDPPEDVVAQELKESAHAVPDDGGAQVTHVHLFGNVGGGEIHHHLSHTDNAARFK